MRSKIFRQVVQKDRRLAIASQEIFVQADENRFKQGVRHDLCGVALKNPKPGVGQNVSTASGALHSE